MREEDPFISCFVSAFDDKSLATNIKAVLFLKE